MPVTPVASKLSVLTPMVPYPPRSVNVATPLVIVAVLVPVRVAPVSVAVTVPDAFGTRLPETS